MVRGHAVAKNAQRPGHLDVSDVSGLKAEVFKEGGQLDVSALFVPLINLPGAGGNLIPLRILRGKITVETAEHLRLEGGLHGVAHLALARPYILQIDFLPA